MTLRSTHLQAPQHLCLSCQNMMLLKWPLSPHHERQTFRQAGEYDYTEPLGCPIVVVKLVNPAVGQRSSQRFSVRTLHRDKFTGQKERLIRLIFIEKGD